tara:strand:+ start:19557 stop:20051 length:495 start_codon:yes stop_codon:yes gene_type:complete
MCSSCGVIFKGISDNFHIKKKTKSGISWNVNCKNCANKINRVRTAKNRKNPKLFIKSKLTSYKYRAQECGVPFDLDSDYLIELFESQGGFCFYTGDEISFENISDCGTTPHHLTPSVDRVDPKLGYTKGNVVWCAYYVNRMKNDFNLDCFIKTCKLIGRRFKDE